MREIIISELAELTGQDAGTFTNDTAIWDIPGFDSLKFVMMISDLQESRHIEIPLDKAIEANTVNDLVTSARSIS